MIAMKFDAASLAAGLELQEGWGYAALDYVEFSMGDSTTLRMTGDHVLQKVLADCENKEKRRSVLSLGGQKKKGADAAPAVDAVAYVAIPLPFSNAGAARSLMFDSSILNRPVTIRVQFKSSDRFFKISTGPVVAPTEFKDLYMVSKTAIMTNPTQSIRELVGMNGAASYSQPYMYPNSWSSSAVIGSHPQSSGTRASVRLDGFQNGSCLSIDLWLRLESFTSTTEFKTSEIGVLYPDNAYLKMRDISVLYGGQVMWQSDDEVDALMALSEYSAGSSFSTTVTKLASGTEKPVTSRWYHVQLSLQNESYFTNLIQHGANLVNNTIEVRFNTPELSEIEIPEGTDTTYPTDATFRLYANVNYQAAVRVAKGSAYLDFVPAVPLLQGTISGNTPF